MIKSMSILVLCAMPLLAQSEHPALGDRVRVMAPKAGYGRLTGQVIATTPDAVQLRLDRGIEVAVMREHIDQMFLSTSTRRHTARGAMIGAAIGGVGMFLWGPKKVGPTLAPGAGKAPAINVLGATIAGAGIGGIVGYYTRTDRWVLLSLRL